ncbi:MAG: hypothetical protein V8S96_04285 [Lachnospiraceae bacterium]
MNIPIPKYFSLYNADKQEIKSKWSTPQGSYYNRLTTIFGKASDCIACGKSKACVLSTCPSSKIWKKSRHTFEK